MIDTPISEIINIQIIPVILLPVTGLALLVFYNRAAAINQRLRVLQRELRELFFKEDSIHNALSQEMSVTLNKEMKILQKRTHIIGISIICCLSAIFLFSLCAFFIALGLYFPWAVQVALPFWFAGPILICTGILTGIIELFYSFYSLEMQSLLIEKWGQDQ